MYVLMNASLHQCFGFEAFDWLTKRTDYMIIGIMKGIFWVLPILSLNNALFELLPKSP